ncbi:MAG: PilZ domain-containing protein [Candidatus Omnitrophica bacterium]|nr:PilZ domain-containing protein [Candidatus Omnitrophota bacterium]
MEERRQGKRILTSLFVRFNVEGSDEKKYIGTFSQDASENGFCIFSDVRPRINDELSMSVDVPNNPDLTMVEGNVRWIGTLLKNDEGKSVFPVGVEITYIEPQDKKYFLDYLKNAEKLTK